MTAAAAGLATMRAAVLHGPRDLRVEDVPAPRPGPGEVLVAVAAAGICGSDLHRYRGLDPWGAGRPGAPRRDGHEIAGRVAELGAGVSGLEPGQPVVVEPRQLAGCGACAPCRRGATQLCVGQRRRSAGFATFDVADAAQVHPVASALALPVAALADVYACALHALHRLPVGVGEPAAIIGTGPLALALGQLARLAGAHVIVVGRRAAALEAARRLGAADATLNGAEWDDLGPAVAGATGGALARAVFEVVGGDGGNTVRQALEAVEPGGRVAILGAFAGDVRVPYREANRKEVALVWSNGYSTWRGRRELAEALALLESQAVPAAGLVTHRFPLAEIARAFAAADDKATSGALKVIVEPDGEGRA